MRGLTEEELKITERFSNTIERLDKIVFPENPIEVFVLQCSPLDEAKRFQYCPKAPNFISNYRGELYLIFGGKLPQRIEEEKNKSIMLFKDSELSKNIYQLPKFSLEEVLIGLSVHEIRHRFQYHNKNKILSPRDVERINDPYLKRLFRYVSLLCEQISPNSFDKEFDAAVVEHIVVELWHEGERSLERIAKIIVSEIFNLI